MLSKARELLGFLRRGPAELRELRAWQGNQPRFVPPGHFYSPIPDVAAVTRHADRIWKASPKTLPGLDLRPDDQFALLERLSQHYRHLPFPEEPSPDFRYFYNNAYYSYSDAVFTFCLMLEFKPRRIVEIGSGFSSALMLDTADRFLQSEVEFTFIEPYPDRLLPLLRASDQQRHTLIQKPVEELQPDVLHSLGRGDILFIDSTHVSKVGSDVNVLMFDWLPVLKPGVLVHVHDILYPFEYPREWVAAGRAWNEAYLWRAFLQYNAAFQILACNTYLEFLFEEFFRQHMPLCLRNRGGSLWVTRA